MDRSSVQTGLDCCVADNGRRNRDTKIHRLADGDVRAEPLLEDVHEAFGLFFRDGRRSENETCGGNLRGHPAMASRHLGDFWPL